MPMPQTIAWWALLVDQPRLLIGQAAQLGHQGVHLLTGGTVDAGHGAVAAGGVGPAGQKGFATLTIGLAQRSVFITQALGVLADAGGYAGQFAQGLQGGRHRPLLLLELGPVLVRGLGVLATQQHILPFLHLGLELNVGTIDQFSGPQRSGHQVCVVIQASCEEFEAAQSNQQQDEQPTGQQGQHLGAQRRFEHDEPHDWKPLRKRGQPLYRQGSGVA